MSLFKSATTSASGTVGCSAKYALPHRPRSSPLTVMNTRERLGRSRAEANASANSISNGADDDGSGDRKSTRLNSSHSQISYAVFCLKKKKKKNQRDTNRITKT